MGYSIEEEDEDKLMLFQMDFIDSEPNKPLQPPHNSIYHSLQEILDKSSHAANEVLEKILLYMEDNEYKSGKVFNLNKWIIMRLKMDYFEASLCETSWISTLGQTTDQTQSLLGAHHALPMYDLSGTEEKLNSIVCLICKAASQCLKEKGLHIPPWRKARYMQSKWLSQNCKKVPFSPLENHVHGHGLESVRYGLEYGVLPSSGYGVWILFPSWSLVCNYVEKGSKENDVKARKKIVGSLANPSTTNTQVSIASTQVSTANLSDATKTGKKITINRSDTTGYDKSKIECFNCHKMGHFAKECRGPRNQDNRNRNQDSSIRTVNVEETSSKAMVAIYGACFDWSYMADDEVPTHMALMAFSDSEVHNNKSFSKTCLKSFETLKTQLDDLRIEFNKSEFNLAIYKRGLASVEEKLVFYKKNEVIFCEQLAVLKRDISYKDFEISMLKSELEKLKQKKESNQLKIKKINNASKSLDKLIGSQITDKSRKGVGFVSYNDVPPPHIGLFSPLNLDLSYSGLEEFQQPEFEGYGPKPSKSVSEDISNEVRESLDAPLVEELVLDDKLEKKTIFPTVAKIEFVRPKQQEKPVRKPVKYAEMYKSQSPRGNQRNLNNQKSQQLGSDFVMYNKACFVCGSFDHVQADCNYLQRKRVVSGNNYTRVNYNYYAKKAHPSAHRNMVPRAVLMKTGLRLLNASRPVNTAHPKTTVYSARPMSHFSKSAQSTVNRPYQIRTTLTYKNFSQKVNTAKGKFYTARPKAVNTASRPRHFKGTQANHTNFSFNIYTHSHIISKLYLGNMSYLLDFKEFDGGYVTFRGGAKGGKINSKGTLTTGVVLLKVHRQNNMYSVDMKNIIPKESLTCLVAKATLDESILWHRRLGHVNFKTINKLVKENLVRGLPIKHFENDQTCVACLKGKQHKASCTNSNDLVGIEESIGIGHSSKETGSSQDYILMPLWKYGLLFDSSSKNASNDEPQPSSDALERRMMNESR
ncbi:ribonuclease H-like domain-containing protein [Tanacetum coccineum]